MNKLNNILVDTQMISVAITDRDIETYGKSLYTWYKRTFDSEDLYIVCTSVTNNGFLGHIVPFNCLDEAIEELAKHYLAVMIENSAISPPTCDCCVFSPCAKSFREFTELFHHQTRNLEQIILTWGNHDVSDLPHDVSDLPMELEYKLRTIDETSKLSVDDFLEEHEIDVMTDFAWCSVLEQKEERFSKMSNEEFFNLYKEYKSNKP